MPKQKLLFCTQKINQGMIRREVRDGAEHIIVKSYTLPKNITMNNGLYPTDEVDKAIPTFQGMPATIAHPMVNGDYVSANDSRIDMEYRFGIWNEYEGKSEDGRVILNKVIPVAKVSKFDKGKRLLDRIEDIENNENAKPMHTSIGVFCEVDELDKPMVNELGQEYTWVARNIVGDHDAFLLDEVGAATPEQGTGIGINSGQEVKVEHFVINSDGEEITNNELSYTEIIDRINQSLRDKYTGSNNPSHIYVEYDSVKSSEFVYCEDGKYYKATYEVDSNDNLSVNDANRIEVQRKTEYVAVNEPQENDNNQQPQSEESAMRDSIIAELKELGFEVNAEISDAELQAKYKEALTADDNGDDALKANQELLDTVSNLEAKLKANEEKELTGKITTIKANSAYSALSDDSLKVIAANNSKEFEEMYTSSIPSHDIGSTHYKPNSDESIDDSMFAVNTEA